MTKSKGQLHVEFLEGVISNEGKIEKANFSLQRGLLKYIEPMFYLTLVQNGVRSLQEFPWSPELEKYLLFQRPRQMDSEEDEAERFAAILLNNLATAEQEHGKDYAQSVLVEILRGRPQDDLRSLLDRIPSHAPSHNSSDYLGCARFLTQSIDGLRNTAVWTLRHTGPEATALMTAALRIVLDETFHISTSEMLFPRR